MTADTAPLVEYLKTDLQRIVNAANEQLKCIRRAELSDSTRQAEEARVINDARAFAVRRVESTVRHLLTVKRKLPPRYEPVNGANHGEKTQRLKPGPPQPEPEQSTETPETSEPPATSPPTPEFSLVEELDSWEPATNPVAHEAAVSEPESLEPAEFQVPSPLDSDDTEVLKEHANLLRVSSPPTAPPVEPPPPVTEPVTPPPPVSMFEPVSPSLVAEPAIDDTEAIRHPVPQAPSEPEHERLERLLKFVARQEPVLRWAVGNRGDGTTLLVTDLAHGWIPPGITLPADVHLLEPARRKGTAMNLLGETTLSATYAPGDPLGCATDADVTDTSSKPRDLPVIDDLGWELTEATHWRDGLPRMVNTLAKACAAGTGILDVEIDMLRAYLDASRYQLQAQYPNVDGGLLLNYLLLAATEGIAVKDQLTTNYHLAWFRLLSAPWVGGKKAGP